MKIVIDIPEEVYKCVMDGTYCGTLYEELKNGTPQPEKRTEKRTETHACDCISRETHACDCISRQAVIGEIADMYDEAKKWGNEAKDDEIKTKAVACMSALIEIKLRLKALPSVEPERKPGNTLEKIRDEITQEADYHDEYVDADIAKGLYMAVEIINKHMEGANGHKME